MWGLCLPGLGVWEVELRAGSLSSSTTSLGPSYPALLFTDLSVSCLVLQLPQPVRGWAAVPALWRLSWLSAQRQPLRQESAQLYPLLAEVSPGAGRAGKGRRVPRMLPDPGQPAAGRVHHGRHWWQLGLEAVRDGHGAGTGKPRRKKRMGHWARDQADLSSMVLSS